MTGNGKKIYFDYRLSSYDINFGIPNYRGQDDYPELYYNIAVKRKFASALISNLTPIFLVSLLLYGALLSVSDGKEHETDHGFSRESIVGTCISVLALFVAMHLQLRQSLPGTGFAYLGFFYVLIYALLLMVVANTLLHTRKWAKYIHQHDNLALKTMCWPFVLLTSVIFTDLYTSTGF